MEIQSIVVSWRLTLKCLISHLQKYVHIFFGKCFQPAGRVGFSADTEEPFGYDWKRKNTPHPFRNQRISTNDDNEEKVRQIMSGLKKYGFKSYISTSF